MSRIFVGNLPMDIRTREVEDIFYKYGRISDIDVKFPSRPPAFAFVDFEDPRDADDAVRGRDGYEFAGKKIRVERANSGGGGRRGSGGGRGGGRGGERGPSRFPRNLKGSGEFTVKVSGLPPRASWQDLKDFGRKAGNVLFSKVDGHGEGLLEYENHQDMENAVKSLDDSEFKNRFDSVFVRVTYANEANERSRSRSPTPKGSSRSRSRTHSRSKSPATPPKHDAPKSVTDAPKPASPVKTLSPMKVQAAPASPVKPATSFPLKGAVSPVKAAITSPVKTAPAPGPVESPKKAALAPGPMESTKKAAPTPGPVTSPKKAADPVESPKKANWSSLRVVDLKEELKKRGLDISGNKADLVKRLEEHTA